MRSRLARGWRKRSDDDDGGGRVYSSSIDRARTFSLSLLGSCERRLPPPSSLYIVPILPLRILYTCARGVLCAMQSGECTFACVSARRGEERMRFYIGTAAVVCRVASALARAESYYRYGPRVYRFQTRLRARGMPGSRSNFFMAAIYIRIGALGCRG